MKKWLLFWWVWFVGLLAIHFFDFQNLHNSWKYVEANDIYESWDYAQALSWYQDIHCDRSLQNSELCFRTYHNLGNTQYRNWERAENIQEKKQFRQKAIESYEKALQLQHDNETQENLDFVSQKLQELEQQEWEKQEGEEDWEKKDGEKKDGEEWEEGNKWEKWEAWEKWESDKEWDAEKWEQSEGEQSWEPKEWELTEQQKQELENYMKNLNYQQVQNQKYFNKKPQQDSQGNMLEDFFNFGQNKKGEESKDW